MGAASSSLAPGRDLPPAIVAAVAVSGLAFAAMCLCVGGTPFVFRRHKPRGGDPLLGHGAVRV